MDEQADGGPVHEGDLEILASCNQGVPDEAGLLAARFARYPGCQQLQVWLPVPGRQCYKGLQVVHGSGTVLVEGAVQERLSGSVQMLFDTLSWPPGDISLRVEHQAGWSHLLTLHKFVGERPLPAPAPPPAPSEGPIVYRDGLGRIIPDADLELRRRAFERLIAEWPRPAADEPPDRDPIER